MKHLFISSMSYPTEYKFKGNSFQDHSRVLNVIRYYKFKKTDLVSLCVHSSAYDFINDTNIDHIYEVSVPKNLGVGLSAKLLDLLGFSSKGFIESFYTFTPFYLDKLKKNILKHDHIYIQSGTETFVSLYCKLKNKKITLDPCGSFFQANANSLFQTPLLALPIWLIRTISAYFIESVNYLLSNQILVSTQIHKNYLSKTFPFINKRKFKIVPPLYDIQKTTFTNLKNNKKQVKIALFLAKFNLHQNKVALLEIIKRQNDIPTSLEIHLVGKLDEAIANKIHSKQIKTLGYVTNLNPVINKADYCIGPTYGGTGPKSKIVIYLLHNKITLTTPQGAIFLPKTGNLLVFKNTSEILDYLIKNKSVSNTNSHSYVDKLFGLKTFKQSLNNIFEW